MKHRDIYILLGVILATGAAAFCSSVEPRGPAAEPHAVVSPLVEMYLQARGRLSNVSPRATRALRDDVRAKQAVLASMLRIPAFTASRSWPR